MKKVTIVLSFILALVAAAMWLPEAEAYEKYNDGCQNCHGSFTGGTSTKGSVFPSNDKHTMHRSSNYMNTECGLCHTAGDNRDPFIGSSDGTGNNPGLGCTGCHTKFGLRAHHAVNGITECAGCHRNDSSPLPENTMPVYYGTADTNADMPCNPDPQANINENWTIGDFEGTDNDGDGIYDSNDSDCAAGCTVDAECDNGEFCDGAETCDTDTGECLEGTSPVTDDGVGCTNDSCDEVNDVVVNAPIDANCDDDDVCNGAETCDPTSDCQSGTTLDCEDGLLCTTDTCDAIDGCANDPVVCQTGEQCDPTDGICKATAECTSDADCDNGLLCDGTETCDGAGACQAGTPVDCSDGVACTEDFCEEGAGCVNIPSDANCDNGLFCDGAETCDPVSDCQAGTDPCGGEVCNETPDTCGAATCGDYPDKGSCNADPNCQYFGKGKNGYCDDAPPPGDCRSLGSRKDCKADSNCSWVDNQCVDYVLPVCSDFTKRNTCTANGCSWDRVSGCSNQFFAINKLFLMFLITWAGVKNGWGRIYGSTCFLLFQTNMMLV